MAIAFAAEAPHAVIRVCYLGPAGTFTEEALRASAAQVVAGDFQIEEVPLASEREVVEAIGERSCELGVVAIENALEGGVAATLDALAEQADRVAIKMEVVHPVRHCLVARRALDLAEVTRVYSHPIATAQCARFLRERLPRAQRIACASTAEAVRAVAAANEPWVALGSQLAAQLYDCVVLASDVSDHAGNETRFVWLEPRSAHRPARGDGVKTSIVFWGSGDERPGWLVSVLSELAERRINLTRIESRPRRIGLGHYMFFCDLEGSPLDRPVAAALEAVRSKVEELRLLGSYPVLRTDQAADNRG